MGDVEANVDAILSFIPRLIDEGVEVAVFPEMCITGYTCADLFHDGVLIEAAFNGVKRIMEESEK